MIAELDLQTKNEQNLSALSLLNKRRRNKPRNPSISPEPRPQRTPPKKLLRSSSKLNRSAHRSGTKKNNRINSVRRGTSSSRGKRAYIRRKPLIPLKPLENKPKQPTDLSMIVKKRMLVTLQDFEHAIAELATRHATAGDEDTLIELVDFLPEIKQNMNQFPADQLLGSKILKYLQYLLTKTTPLQQHISMKINETMAMLFDRVRSHLCNCEDIEVLARLQQRSPSLPTTICSEQEVKMMNETCLQASSSGSDEENTSSGESRQNGQNEIKNPQLRKKICQKMAKMLEETYTLGREETQTSALRIEALVRDFDPFMGDDYKGRIYLLMKSLKAKCWSKEEVLNPNKGLLKERVKSQETGTNGCEEASISG